MHRRSSNAICVMPVFADRKLTISVIVTFVLDYFFFNYSYELIIHKRAHEKEKEEGFYSVQAQLNAKIANLNKEPVGIDTNNDSAVPLQTQQNSSGSALQCAKCFSFWPTQKRLWLHHNAAHREKIQCTLCTETFNYE